MALTVHNHQQHYRLYKSCLIACEDSPITPLVYLLILVEVFLFGKAAVSTSIFRMLELVQLIFQADHSQILLDVNWLLPMTQDLYLMYSSISCLIGDCITYCCSAIILTNFLGLQLIMSWTCWTNLAILTMSFYNISFSWLQISYTHQRDLAHS